nr:MAG TPA: hypothetical protein [Bacteriophage sp.]
MLTPSFAMPTPHFVWYFHLHAFALSLQYRRAPASVNRSRKA